MADGFLNLGLGIMTPVIAEALLIIIVALWFLSLALVLYLIFFERSDPRTIALWMAVMLLMPAVGFFIYLCFGHTFYRRRHFAIKNFTDENLFKMKEDSLKEISMKKAGPENEEEMRFAKSLMESGNAFYSADNKLDLYLKGEEFFKRMFEDLRNAVNFIHAEYYIIRDDKLSNEFLSILIEKAKAGVEVKLLVDAIGFPGGLNKRIKELKKAGGEFKLFHRAVTVFLSPKKNNRNHRKLLAIDGTKGYVSGFNIGDEYLGTGEAGRWRDTGLRIEGQSAIAIGLRFLMDWGYATKKHLDINAYGIEKYFPSEAAGYGNDVMQLISGGPDTKNNPIELQYLKILSTAKKTLYIHTPYLVPSDNVMKGLILSARSGVDVRIIMPDRPDHLFVFWASIMNAGELMKNGIRVYRYKGGFVHSKTLVADGKYCSIGSANLDQRSVTLNFETNAMVYSKRIGEEMHNAFLDDLNYCAEYSIEEYSKLTRWQNFKISVARLFSSWA